MKKKYIKTIQQYFEILDSYLEDLFEGQRTKLLFGVGYNMGRFLDKTIYRIQNLFIALKEILEKTSQEDLLVFLEEKDKLLEKGKWENLDYDLIATKKYTRKLIEDILWFHSGDLIDIIKDGKFPNFKNIESIVFETLRDNIYKYESKVHRIRDKHGNLVYRIRVYKEKAVTERLRKKKKWK